MKIFKRLAISAIKQISGVIVLLILGCLILSSFVVLTNSLSSGI